MKKDNWRFPKFMLRGEFLDCFEILLQIHDLEVFNKKRTPEKEERLL